MTGPTTFIHTCTIQKNTPGAKDHHGGGATAESWANDQTNVACRFTNLTEQRRYNEPRGVVPSDIPVILLPSTATVEKLTYRIVTTEDEFEGTYDIIRIHRRPTFTGTNHITAVLQVVTA
jgi:hypothetical protein